METSQQLRPADDELGLPAISAALRGLRFGSVTVIVQDGVVIQVERLEKNRLPRRSSRSDDATA